MESHIATMLSSMAWSASSTFSVVIIICVASFGKLALERPEIPTMLAFLIGIVVSGTIGSLGLHFTPLYSLIAILLSVVVGAEITMLRKAGYLG